MRRTAMQKLKKAGNPVLEPMSFTEFLLAQDETGLVDCLRNWNRLEPLPQLLFEPLGNKCRHYHTVGGLPEAVSAWCEKRDLTLAREAQQAIADMFREDILRCADPRDIGSRFLSNSL